MQRRLASLAVGLLALTGCGSADQPGGALSAAPAPATSSTTAAAAAAPSTTVAAPAPTAPATVAPATSAFASSLSTVTAADLPASWRPGCPVSPDELRMVRLSFWGFDDQPHTGAVVVHADVAADVVKVFRRLYDERFPIRRMEPIDAFGGSDDASIAADNTAAFNCRNAVASGAPQWSMHAYGKAIDVNPVENPYLLEGSVLPPAGAAFLDRSNYRPGMAVEGGVLTSAFSAAGWYWGGRWASPDYQHFSTNGS